MATLPESVDYTDKDFDALRARLIALIKSVFPDWTDFDVASFGNLLVELYAFVGDVLTFYQDNLARESRLVTATQRKSVMALAKMLGYRLQGAQAATASVVLQLARVPTASVTIPAGTVVRTQEVTQRQAPQQDRNRCTATVLPGLCRRDTVPGVHRHPAGGGTFSQPISCSSSAASSRALVAAQYFGASSR